MATKLELCNHMLSVQGIRGQVSLTTGHPSILKAIATLDSVNEDFQSRGWYFNTETCVTLVRSEINEVIIPANCTEFRVSSNTLQNLAPGEKLRYVQRGTRVYDTVMHTYAIGHTIYADLTLRLEVEDLPSAASSYLKHKAAEDFFNDEDGDSTKATKLGERTQRAWQQLQAANLKAMAPNVFDSPAAMNLKYRIQGSYGYGNPNIIGGRPR